ncbi:MAG TPA: cytochrome b N-terminal domain-containing protein, partial [Thermodesulfobacteriota bacterium]|nr:cytochrome b N-terminal domain-containing protein [Thermodesulfobacteriota bacterium]
EMRLGWLIRGMHYRGSSGMVLVVVIHVFRTFCHATYKRPNEVTWMTGVMLLFLTLGMAFTGYLLPWSNISYWATTVAIFIVDSVPLVGSWAARLLGGTEVGAITLTRFYAFHVLLIPGLLVVIVGVTCCWFSIMVKWGLRRKARKLTRKPSHSFRATSARIWQCG